MAFRDQVQTQLDNMSPRDRRLATGLLAFLMLVVVYLTWSQVSSRLSAMQSDLDRVATVRDRIALMMAEYEVAEAEVTQSEDRLSRFQGQQVTTFVEAKASEAGIRDELRAVDPTENEVIGNIKQSTYKIQVQRASLDGIVQFLHALETDEFPIVVSSARFKTNFVKGERLISLDLEVVAYELVDA